MSLLNERLPVVGDRVRRITPPVGSNITHMKVGDIYTVAVISSGTHMTLKDLPNTWAFKAFDYVWSVDDLNREIERLHSKVKDLQTRKEWMTINDRETFDLQEYKVFNALLTIEDDTLTRVEKASLIAKLITS